jgi:nucleoside phosphorylase/CheY-like chemotaxis protein
MKVLIIDDDQTKVREVLKVLASAGIAEEFVDTSGSVVGAAKLLKESEYGLLVLDLVLPMRLSDEPSDLGGTRLLSEIVRDSSLNRPEHIVGLTVSEEALEKAQPEFSRGLWSIVRYGPDVSEWKDALVEKARYLLARENVEQENILSKTDILVICALARPELSQLKLSLGDNFEEILVYGDHTRYFRAEIPLPTRGVSVTVCSAPSMGLTAAASLTTKACMHFRPKIVVMTGICAGRKGEVKLGQCIVASTSWDYGSGKFVGSADGVQFKANPYQLAIDPAAQSAAEAVLGDQAFLDRTHDRFQGNKPDQRLTGLLAPLASGAAVQAHGEFFESVAQKQVRKVAGIDMEAFAVSWAAREATEPKPLCVIAKSVADFADEEKADDFQDYCSFTSASIGFEIATRLI